MRGNTEWQIQALYNTVAAIGESKHAAKEAARENGASTFAEIAKETGIFSYATADSYRDVWRAVAEHSKAEFGIKDMQKITTEHVTSFLSEKVNEGVARSTFDVYASAIEKLEVALNRYSDLKADGKNVNFDLKEIRQEAAAELGLKAWNARAYSAPQAIAANVQERHQLAAQLQHNGGARVKEISLIKESQLREIKMDEKTGQMRGHIAIKGKGGKGRELKVSPAIYHRLEKEIQKGGGVYKIESYSAYIKDIEKAAGKSGQTYNGSHGLRWNAAQEYMSACQKNGKSYEEGLLACSEMLGHARPDITERYMKV
jgi:integrase